MKATRKEGGGAIFLHPPPPIPCCYRRRAFLPTETTTSLEHILTFSSLFSILDQHLKKILTFFFVPITTIHPPKT